MPTSFFNNIHEVLTIVEELKPKSVLDVGCGWGKYGVLLREYWGRNPSNKFIDRLDACEAFKGYIGPVHEAVYDHIYIGDIRKKRLTLDPYDLYLLIDMCDHMPMEDAVELIKSLPNHKLVVVPKLWTPQGAEFGNEFEVHHSHWQVADIMRNFPKARVSETNNVLIFVVEGVG